MKAVSNFTLNEFRNIPVTAADGEVHFNQRLNNASHGKIGSNYLVELELEGNETQESIIGKHLSVKELDSIWEFKIIAFESGFYNHSNIIVSVKLVYKK